MHKFLHNLGHFDDLLNGHFYDFLNWVWFWYLIVEVVYKEEKIHHKTKR